MEQVGLDWWPEAGAETKSHTRSPSEQRNLLLLIGARLQMSRSLYHAGRADEANKQFQEA